MTVSGDFGNDVETCGRVKTASGARRRSAGPEMYVYYFTADGVRLTDPSNPQVKIGYVTTRRPAC